MNPSLRGSKDPGIQLKKDTVHFFSPGSEDPGIKPKKTEFIFWGGGIQGSRDLSKKDTVHFLSSGSRGPGQLLRAQIFLIQVLRDPRIQGYGQKKTQSIFFSPGSEDQGIQPKKDTVHFLAQDPGIQINWNPAKKDTVCFFSLGAKDPGIHPKNIPLVF